MPRLDLFRAKALLGYAVVILLLGGALIIGVGRLDRVAAAELAGIQEEERKATTAEQLRWSATASVAAGRGYLMSGDPSFLVELEQAERMFDQRVQELWKQSITPEGLQTLTRVERAATAYLDGLRRIIGRRVAGLDGPQLPDVFESEMRPLRRELDAALDALVRYRAGQAQAVYEEGEQARARWVLGARTLTGALVLLSVGLAWYFSRLLAQSHWAEQTALATAQRAVRARDELLGIVAHDLRNPLGAIAMKAASLRRTVEPGEVRRYAESIENVTMRMEYLIKSMLDVATMEMGQFSVTPARWEVAFLVGETMEMFGSLARSKQIRLGVSVPEPGLAVRADRERVIQVLSNLMGNALKYTPPGGRVTIAVERQGEAACFRVSDTGPGIRDEQMPHIFDRFWKDERSGTKGSGLGLFIAKGIVEAHGGRIWAESQPGQGATFFFTLPVAGPELQAARPAEGGEAHPAAH
jgi:signal transduction histidine kinase